MQFEFNNQLVPQNLVEVDNIGSFGLEAFNDDGEAFYYIVQTIMGQCIIASCGPVIPDLRSLPPGFTININRMPYNEARIIKNITLFLNDKYKKIISATEIDIEDAIEQFRDVKEYLRDLDAENL